MRNGRICCSKELRCRCSRFRYQEQEVALCGRSVTARESIFSERLTILLLNGPTTFEKTNDMLPVDPALSIYGAPSPTDPSRRINESGCLTI